MEGEESWGYGISSKNQVTELDPQRTQVGLITFTTFEFGVM